MKKLLLTGAIALTSLQMQAQTVLYTNNFEGAPGFTLNSSDLGGAASADNPWIINNVYAGGSGSFFCAPLSFTFPFTVPPAPSQPAGISPQNGNHLHVTPQIAIDAGGSLPAASYIAPDGFCIFGGQSTFSRMSSDFSTVGSSTVTADFWWACGGSTLSYGEMYYSLNGGTTWTAVNCPITATNQWRGQTTWLNSQISDPAWANQATLRFGFRFVTGTSSGTELDPGFAIDDFDVIGSNPAAASISTSNLSLTSWCSGTTIDDVLDFTATGTYNAGNVYTAQLSDGAGSFAAPTTIGTLASTASGLLSVNINIPGSTPAGSAYRVRVVASNPSTIGTDNGVDIVINQTPTVTLGALSNVCVYNPSFSLSGGSPAGGIYSGPGVTGGMFDPATAGLGTHTITYTYTDPNGCLSSATQTILVDACVGLTDLENDAILIHPNPASAQFSLSSTSGIESVELVDMNGRVVKRFNEAAENYDITEIQGGVYFVHIEFEGFTSIKQLVIR